MNVTLEHPTNQPNFTRVEINDLTLWFSYKTVIAFYDGNRTVVSENVWGPTTGKHLNYIGGPRTERTEFERLLSAALERN